MSESTDQRINGSTSQQVIYILQIADTILIHAQRLGEWCGHGPILEQDIALTNTALDHIGAARSLYQHAAAQFNALPPEAQQSIFTSPALEMKLAGTQQHPAPVLPAPNGESTSQRANGSTDQRVTEDDLAYLRDAWDFHNALLVEQPNGDWAYTVARSFFLDAFNYYFYKALQQSSDKTLAAVAEKSLKEVTYHLKWSSEWVIRLGDGTEESHIRMQEAVNNRWAYTGELFNPSAADHAALQAGYGADLAAIKPLWDERVAAVFSEAGLDVPAGKWMQQGGKNGTHSEHLGYILAEMQYLQRTYPGMEW